VLSNYEPSFDKIQVHEGGRVDDPKDPGGRTNRGVTQRVFTQWLRARNLPNRDVWTITRTEASAICKVQYWDKCNCDSLAAGLDLSVADPAFNSGVGKGIKWRDGAMSATGETVDRIHWIAAKRLSFLHALGTWSRFGKGWAARVADIEATSLKMAVAAGHAPAIFISKAAVAARGKATRRVDFATMTGGTGAGIQAAHSGTIGSTGLIIACGVALAAAAAFAGWSAMRHNERAKALTEAAK
jgi:lysozyme family protein